MSPVPYGWTASTAAVDAAAHAALTAGYHGTGTTQVATTADIATHAALTATHGTGTARIASTTDIATHAALTASVHGLPFNVPFASAVTAQFNKTTDTALANVTGLALTLAGTTTYILEAILFVTADAVGGHKYTLDGTVTASSIRFQVNSISNASNLNVINTTATALAQTTGQAGATGVYTEIMGTIVTNAAGTLNVQFAEQVSSGTSSVLTQSYFQATKVS